MVVVAVGAPPLMQQCNNATMQQNGDVFMKIFYIINPVLDTLLGGCFFLVI